MFNDANYREDLPRLATESFELSSHLCRTCRDMHALGPYIRMARGWAGVEPPSSPLQLELTKLIATGRKKVLIAGSQDTGLLALVARAGANFNPEIVVLDRCATPLALCRRLAQRWLLPIETLQEDSIHLAAREHFDIILVHFTLQHISNDCHDEVVIRLRQALHSSGCLLLSFHTSRKVEIDLSDYSRRFADWVIEEMEQIQVSLPEGREALRARLRGVARDHETRQGVFHKPEDIQLLLERAGFDVRKRFEIGLGVTRANPVQDLIGKIMRRRFLVIAEPATTS